MHFNYPVNKDCSHFFIDVLLMLHVTRLRLTHFFLLKKKGRYKLSVLANCLGVFQVLHVYRRCLLLAYLIHSLVPEFIEFLFYFITAEHILVRLLFLILGRIWDLSHEYSTNLCERRCALQSLWLRLYCSCKKRLALLHGKICFSLSW